MTLSANISMAVSNWLLLVIIAKVFGDHQLGEVALSLSVLSPLFLLASFKLRTLLITDTQNEYQISQYFHARLLANNLLLLLTPLLCWTLLDGINATVVMLIALYKWCDSWFELTISVLHRQKAFTSAGLWIFARALCTALALICAFWFEDVLLTLTLWVSVTAMFALLSTFNCRRQVSTVFNQTFSLALFQAQALRRSLFLFRKYRTLSMALMFSSLFIYLPNLFLQHLQGISEAGRFAAVSYFLVAGSMLITSISQTAQPYLSQLQAQQQFRTLWIAAFKLCLSGLAIGLMALLLVCWLGPRLLALIYHQGMTDMSAELNWIMAAAMVRYGYIFLGTTLNAFRLFQVQTRIALAGTLTVAVACLLLVPGSGTLGAAQAMFMATCVEMVLYLVYLLRRHNLAKEEVR
ncbi:lipopolysaccharide biosynthesis protein [Lacimicrobium alkaliphilum]|uniref:Polysaccharide biosynthesis protein C-terminal domain-containing protein n=1 Tax=Lacimicrobium alkaliphilum TaxID=1526571 RepID=A0A0U2QMG9_9ALTE|nr:hypothetical protein [Lacimicrobium alkaliphilum]ALS98651.1 hypothetical protein AT746_10470 [Lacimicrobium alkaliphilum]